jgi:hypothetical protein
VAQADGVHDGEVGTTLCALGIAEEMREAGIAPNVLWLRTLVATAAVQNRRGDEVMARARKPAVYADAVYAANDSDTVLLDLPGNPTMRVLRVGLAARVAAHDPGVRAKVHV